MATVDEGTIPAPPLAPTDESARYTALVNQLLSQLDQPPPVQPQRIGPARSIFGTLGDALIAAGRVYGHQGGGPLPFSSMVQDLRAREAQQAAAQQAETRDTRNRIRIAAFHRELEPTQQRERFAPFGRGGIYNTETGQPTLPSQDYATTTEGDRPTVVGPGAAFVPHGQTTPSFTQPNRPQSTGRRFISLPGTGVFDTQTLDANGKPTMVISARDPRFNAYVNAYTKFMSSDRAILSDDPEGEAAKFAERAVSGGAQYLGQPPTAQKTGVQRIRELMNQGMDADAATKQAAAEGYR